MDEKQNAGPKIWHLIITVLVVLLIWAVSGYLVHSSFSVTGRGTFGDMFGAVNALFSGLAFAVLIFAIFLQRHEIKLQRKDLEFQSRVLDLTREEIKGQKHEMEMQNETLRTQSFENTFFQMLGLHNEIVENISHTWLNDVQGVRTGRNCLAHIFKEFKYYNSKNLIGANDYAINKKYLHFYSEYEHLLGHYFRNMYNIVKFVKNNPVKDKKLYTNLLRAQLSAPELALLFYNCLSKNGVEKFKPLIEEFALLKNLPPEILIDLGHKKFFKPYAFDENKYIHIDHLVL